MRGLPDWARPAAHESLRLYAPFERDGSPLALPDALAIATEPNGRPEFRITAIRAVGPGGARAFGRLDLELALTSAADEETARAAPALRGWLRLRSAMLDLPGDLAAPIELDCSGLGLARMAVPLGPEGVGFVEHALRDGMLPVQAVVDIEVAGVAPRPGGAAVVDLARLGALLTGGDVTPAALCDRLIADPAGAGVVFDDVPDAGIRPAAIAEAVVDHIRAVLCPGPLLPRADGGLGLAPLDPAIAAGRATLDLGRALVATRAVALALDPFQAARGLAAQLGGVDALIVRGVSAPLPTGRRRLAIDAGLRRPLAGPLALGATLRFPPRPPARPHEIRRDFELPPDGAGVQQEVQLAPSEPLDWTLAAFALWPTANGRGVERLVGEPQTVSGAQALLRPSAFPLAVFDLAADPALLALAEVAVTVSGARNGGAARAFVTLTNAAPRSGAALPRDAEAPQMSAELAPRSGGAPITLGPKPAADWRIALTDTPGYGARAIEIAVALPAATLLAAVEIRAEDAEPETEPAVYAFTAATPVRTHRWFCNDPFRPGIVWRWRGTDRFSEPVRGLGRLDLTLEGAAA